MSVTSDADRPMAAPGGDETATTAAPGGAVPVAVAGVDGADVTGDEAGLGPVQAELIYGADDRKDDYQVFDRRLRKDIECVVALFEARHVVNVGSQSVLTTQLARDRLSLCADERFADQPCGAFATGFLVGRDIVATAGHAISQETLASTRFVFGFVMAGPGQPVTTIPNADIYRGVRIVERVVNSDAAIGPDWALVQLDRPVTGRRVASVRRSGTVQVGQPVHAIGFPKGLPLKVAPNATVVPGGTSTSFFTNLDTAAGNSGSPVFNTITHEVEGIFVRGLSGSDLAPAGPCWRWSVAPADDAGHSDCTRLSAAIVKHLGPVWQELDDNPATIAIAASGSRLYQLRRRGHLYQYSGTPFMGWTFLDNNSRTVEIVADGSALYQRHRDTGAIFKSAAPPSTGWQQIGGNPLTASLTASAGRFYQLQHDGVIWRYTGTPMTGWEMLDNNPQTTSLAADGVRLYQLHKTGRIYQYMGVPMSGWALLDNNARTVAIAAGGGKLYQVHDTGRVYEYTGVPLVGWALIDDSPDPKTLVVDGPLLYKRHASGQVFRYTRTPLTGWEPVEPLDDGSEVVAAGGRLYQLTNAGSVFRLAQ